MSSYSAKVVSPRDDVREERVAGAVGSDVRPSGTTKGGTDAIVSRLRE